MLTLAVAVAVALTLTLDLFLPGGLAGRSDKDGTQTLAFHLVAVR